MTAVRNSGLPASALIEVGDDHRLADPEPLRKMLEACEGATGGPTPDRPHHRHRGRSRLPQGPGDPPGSHPADAAATSLEQIIFLWQNAERLPPEPRWLVAVLAP